MHPALSVIVFTTLSGAGSGLLMLLCAGAGSGRIPADPWLGVVGFALALGAITAGLISSAFHLGRPERAWRAFSQWRSSWLSREGVLAVLAYIPALWLAKGWILDGVSLTAEPWRYIALAAAVLAALTVVATGMIYASLKAVPQWHNGWVLPSYLLLGLASGGLWFNALLHVFGLAVSALDGWLLLVLMVAWLVKLLYWLSIDRPRSRSTVATATGLGEYGRIRVLDAPHADYLLTEMGFHIARKHATKLRRVALVAGFALPFVLTALAAAAPSLPATAAAILAAPLATAGILVERWLFFAEAKHAVTLYFGADKV
jgi:DMSO reductase anchor subunit